MRKGIAEQIPLDVLCENTMDHCLASDSGMTGVGCDNMTMVIVAILNGKTLEEWYEHITKRVAVRLGPADSTVRANGDEDPEALEEQASEPAQENSAENNQAEETVETKVTDQSTEATSTLNTADITTEATLKDDKKEEASVAEV